MSLMLSWHVASFSVFIMNWLMRGGLELGELVSQGLPVLYLCTCVCPPLTSSPLPSYSSLFWDNLCSQVLSVAEF